MKKVILLAAAVSVLAGCQTEKIETPVPGLVKIVPVMTKVTDVNFENGDKVGVTIMQGDVAYAQNQLLTYSDNVFSGTLNWYAEALTPSTLTAYYPYASEGAPSTFKVAADQTSGYGVGFHSRQERGSYSFCQCCRSAFQAHVDKDFACCGQPVAVRNFFY